jgi:hypothetical protein
MSELKVNKITPRSGTGVTLGDSGDTFTIPAGASMVNNGTATGFGATGAVNWDTTAKTSGFTAVSGVGYFCNTTSASFTVTLPATPSAGNIIGLIDYAGTADTNAIVINPNGNKIEGATANLALAGEREGVVLVYVDSTQGWLAISGINEGTDALEPNAYSIDFLVIAGGGGGGNLGGGGGAGGYRTSTQTIERGTTITVTVGDGGATQAADGEAGNSGSDSSISGSGMTTITSTGGGGAGAHGASGTVFNGKSGGSGGGGGSSGQTNTTGGAGNTPNTSPSQGNSGGNGTIANGEPSGGGGGSGAVGGNSSGSVAGSGGNGTASSITGSSVTRAGGGGGCGRTDQGSTAGSGGSGGGGNGTNTNSAGGAGSANTGSGGGGGGYNGAFGDGGAGGKGVVILSMLTTKYSGTSTGSPTVTTSGSNTILQFNGSGSYTT